MPSYSSYHTSSSSSEEDVEVPFHVERKSWWAGASRGAIAGAFVGLTLMVLVVTGSFRVVPAANILAANEDDDGLKDAIQFIQFSDTHVDPFFDPARTAKVGVCHTCELAPPKKSTLKAVCPTGLPPVLDGQVIARADLGFAFGRLGCNPPPLLLYSALHSMKERYRNPRFIVFTGDMAPHGMPDDGFKVTATTTLADLCPVKLEAFRAQVKTFRSVFPETTFIFSMGNNDHFPKNIYWDPYMQALNDMFLEEGFFSAASHGMFKQFGGSHYIDIAQEDLEADVLARGGKIFPAKNPTNGIRFICLNLSLFGAGGETTFVNPADHPGLDKASLDALRYPVRHRTVEWFEAVVKEAKEKNTSIILVGHQPLESKEGEDDMDIDSRHYGRLRQIMDDYSNSFSLGMFGHINMANFGSIVDAQGKPDIPTITAPGISPRAVNNPSYNQMFLSIGSKRLVDSHQWFFDLVSENTKARNGGFGSVKPLEIFDKDRLRRFTALQDRAMGAVMAQVASASRSSADTNKERKTAAVEESFSDMGTWYREKKTLGETSSWRALMGEEELTIAAYERFITRMYSNGSEWNKYSEWRKSCHVGGTPEVFACKAKFSTAQEQHSCLFPNQGRADPKCFEGAKWALL